MSSYEAIARGTLINELKKKGFSEKQINAEMEKDYAKEVVKDMAISLANAAEKQLRNICSSFSG